MGEGIFLGFIHDTYRAHPAAMRVKMGKVRGTALLKCVRREWVDLSTYLEDPHLPRDLRAGVEELRELREVCGPSVF